ncbi:M16 family metallopeptidase [Prosthecomicrobium pneumaticum]|uniref:Zinc protease n=1 Tax=Prosthecomicrobium pneumaticum TaxID=81895 RepID=A0A7W9CUE2_9HYPH|nr:pitrilysin family protein [Prosthecomicrobium pneumaticum]MBB5752115.1 zinc protease [Prosthecomicrobium pneumaticum]
MTAMFRSAAVRLAQHSLAVAAAAGFALFACAAQATTVERVVSPKGIEAWLVEEQAVPLVAMNFAFRGGAAQDPPEKPGVANLLSGMLDEGAGDLPSEAFQARLDDLSVELSFSAGREAFFGTLRTLVETRDEAFSLLKRAITVPRFDDEPLARMKDAVTTGIRAASTDPDSLASQALAAAMFPGHPYGRPIEGTERTVAAITRDDLELFRRAAFARSNLRIVVVGAIDAKTLGPLLDATFGDLPENPFLRPVPDVKPADAGLVEVAFSTPQAVIRFAGNGLERHDPDFMPAFVANHILGGAGFSSRLYAEVREKRGLAYSVGTGLATFDHAAAFFGGTATRADRGDEALTLIETEIRRLASEGPTEAELDQAKHYLIGSFALRFDTSSRIASQLLAFSLDGLGIDYVEHRNDLVAAVTIEDVRRAARRVFEAGPAVVVRVGPKPS